MSEKKSELNSSHDLKEARLKELREEILKEIDEKEGLSEEGVSKKEPQEGKLKSPLTIDQKEAVEIKEDEKTIQTKPAIFKEDKRRFIKGLISGVVSLILIFFIIFSAGLYKYNWSGHLIDKIVKIVPYPAIIINWDIIKYSDYNEELNTFKNFYEKQKSISNGNIPVLTETEIKEAVLDKIIKSKLIEQSAEKYELKVTDEELDKVLEDIINEAGSKEAVENILKELYNWNLEEFKTNILKTDLLGGKLKEKILEDSEIEETDLIQYLEKLEGETRIWNFVN